MLGVVAKLPPWHCLSQPIFVTSLGIIFPIRTETSAIPRITQGKTPNSEPVNDTSLKPQFVQNTICGTGRDLHVPNGSVGFSSHKCCLKSHARVFGFSRLACIVPAAYFGKYLTLQTMISFWTSIVVSFSQFFKHCYLQRLQTCNTTQFSLSGPTLKCKLPWLDNSYILDTR